MKKVIVALAAGVLLIIGLASCEDEKSDSGKPCTDGAIDPETGKCAVFDPMGPGPYPVGTVNLLFWDDSRDALMYRNCEEYAATGRCPRPIVTQVWYPADDSSIGGEQMDLQDFLPISPEEMNALIDELATGLGGDPEDYSFEQIHRKLLAVENAPIRDGKYPLIIFSHGAGGVRFQSVFLTEILAQHGYIVISPDHEGDSTVLIVDGEVAHWPRNPNDPDDFLTVQDWMVSSATNRVTDIGYLLDRAEEMTRDKSNFFGGHIDTSHVGMTGHSFGALTSVTMAYLDNRIDAIVPMAMFGLSDWTQTVPSFFMIAGEDDTIQEDMNKFIRLQYDYFPPPKYSLELTDAGHFSYSNMCDLIPDFGDGCGVGKRHVDRSQLFPYPEPGLLFNTVNFYTLAFFGRYIKMQSEYEDFLVQEPFYEQIRYSYKYKLDHYSEETTSESDFTYPSPGWEPPPEAP